MPPRNRKTVLPDEVREAFKERLTQSRESKDRAEEDFYVDVYLMNKAGLTFDEIAAQLRTSSSTVDGWKKKGEEAYRRRESTRDRQLGEDPFRSGQREPVG